VHPPFLQNQEFADRLTGSGNYTIFGWWCHKELFPIEWLISISIIKQHFLSIRGHWYSYICMAYACYLFLMGHHICLGETQTLLSSNNNKHCKSNIISRGKRHFCMKIAVFRISIESLFDIKKTYWSLAFQYLNDLCLTNLKRLSLSASYFYILICLSEILGPFPEIL
jgi:hypothetical protein